VANTLATPTWTLKETTRQFTNEVTFVRNINRTYDDSFVQAGAKVGDTVRARLPQRFVVTDGQALQIQNLFDATVPISLTNQKNIGFSYSSAQATTDLDSIRSRYTQPAAEHLANAADVLAFNAVYRDVYNAIGTPGTTVSTTLAYLQGGVKLTDIGTPLSGRKAVLDPYAMAVLANAASTLFNPSATIGEAYTKGQFGREQLGVAEWYQDANRPVHTTGTFTASTPIINGANQTGSTLITNGWASSAATLKKGDIFTIAGVNSINRLSYQSSGRLQQFTVTADTTSVGVDMATLPISPPIIVSGALATVDAIPASGAAITVWSANPAGGTLATTTSPTGLVYIPDAFAFVMADLRKPTAGVETAQVRSKAWGVTIRMVEQYQIGTDQNPSRLDMLIGAAAVRPEFAYRVQG